MFACPAGAYAYCYLSEMIGSEWVEQSVCITAN